MSKCESCGKNWAEHGGIQATCSQNEKLLDAVCEAWDALDVALNKPTVPGVAAACKRVHDDLGKVIREEPNDKRARIAAVIAAAREVAEEYGETKTLGHGSKYTVVIKPSDHMLDLVAALKEINS